MSGVSLDGLKTFTMSICEEISSNFSTIDSPFTFFPTENGFTGITLNPNSKRYFITIIEGFNLILATASFSFGTLAPTIAITLDFLRVSLIKSSGLICLSNLVFFSQ